MQFPTWAKNILFLLVYMISGLILVIVIEGLMSGSELIPFNNIIEEAMVYIRTPVMTTFLVWVTNIGSPFVLSSVAVFLAALLVTKGNVYDALLVLFSLAVAVTSFVILKNIFQINRPDSPIYSTGGWSFPSGHATVATAFFFIVAHSFFYNMRTGLKKSLLVLGCLLGAGLVCLSRLYLGAHWGLDVLAGIALGLLSVSFTVLVFNIFLGSGRGFIKRPNI